MHGGNFGFRPQPPVFECATAISIDKNQPSEWPRNHVVPLILPRFPQSGSLKWTRHCCQGSRTTFLFSSVLDPRQFSSAGRSSTFSSGRLQSLSTISLDAAVITRNLILSAGFQLACTSVASYPFQNQR
jgi:hypothetical protein